MSKLGPSNFLNKKRRHEPIAVLTAYDYFTAHLIMRAGLDAILVGDSLAMVALGYANTLPVTLDEMIHHTKAVRRGAADMFVIGDLPFEACRESPKDMVKAAERFLDEGRCDAVKVEGADDRACEAIRMMRKKGIAVMGHVGLLPQALSRDAKPFKVQGTDAVSARRILEEACTLSELGVFSVVLECIPADLTARITKKITPPTIGIGAGSACNGQVLVTDDLLGRYDRIRPKFVKQYLDSSRLTHEALLAFKKDVKECIFPSEQHAFSGK